MKLISTTFVALSLAVIAGTAFAEGNFLKYGEVEGWKIFIDREKKSCLIEAIDDVGNVVQMGLTRDRGVGYLGVFTKGETTIQAGAAEAVAIMLGDNIYLGEAVGTRGNITNGYSGGYVLSDDPQFARDIAQQYEMIVFPETEYAFVVDLAGTRKAMEMARECNQKQISG